MGMMMMMKGRRRLIVHRIVGGMSMYSRGRSSIGLSGRGSG